MSLPALTGPALTEPAYAERPVSRRAHPIRVTPAPPMDPVRGQRPVVMTFGRAVVADLETDRDFEPQHTPARELPPPGAFAASLTRQVLEVLALQRPIGQLMRWVDHDIYQSVARRIAIHSRQPRSTARSVVVVRSVRTCELGESIVEVCIVATHGSTVRPVAMRLEALDHRWRCTALELS